MIVVNPKSLPENKNAGGTLEVFAHSWSVPSLLNASTLEKNATKKRSNSNSHNPIEKHLKKRFQNNLAKGSHLLFCISDPDHDLLSQEKRDNEDTDFTDCVELITNEINAPYIKEVTLCPTFLLSRWNILCDIIVMVDKSISENAGIGAEKSQGLIAAQLFGKMFDEKSIEELTAITAKIFDLFTDLKKSPQLDYGKIYVALEEIAEALKPEALRREKLWREVNKIALDKLQLKTGKAELAWSEFLKNNERTEKKLQELLPKNSESERIYFEKLKIAQVMRWRKKYKNLKLSNEATILVNASNDKHNIEENKFNVYLPYFATEEFTHQVHDGSLTKVTKYVIEKLGATDRDKKHIPFIVISDNPLAETMHDTSDSKKLFPKKNSELEKTDGTKGSLSATDVTSKKGNSGNAHLLSSSATKRVPNPAISTPSSFFPPESKMRLTNSLFDIELEKNDSIIFKQVTKNCVWQQGIIIVSGEGEFHIKAVKNLLRDLGNLQNNVAEAVSEQPTNPSNEPCIYERNYQMGSTKVCYRIEVTENDKIKREALFKEKAKLTEVDILAEIDSNDFFTDLRAQMSPRGGMPYSNQGSNANVQGQTK